jgi:hypothetical protein
VVLAVRSEPLSPTKGIPCYAGNLQGIVVEIGYSRCIDGPQVTAITELSDAIPCASEQGIFFGEQGLTRPNRELESDIRASCGSSARSGAERQPVGARQRYRASRAHGMLNVIGPNEPCPLALPLIARGATAQVGPPFPADRTSRPQQERLRVSHRKVYHVGSDSATSLRLSYRQLTNDDR